MVVAWKSEMGQDQNKHHAPFGSILSKAVVENDQGTEGAAADQLAKWEEMCEPLTSFLATFKAAKVDNVNTAIEANGGTNN